MKIALCVRFYSGDKKAFPRSLSGIILAQPSIFRPEEQGVSSETFPRAGTISQRLA